MEQLLDYAPSAGALLVTVIGLWVVNRILERRLKAAGHGMRNQLIMLALSFAGMLIIVVLLPLEEAARGNLFTLLGILLSAAIALSSTTFLGNAMAGVMMQAVRSFRIGDFIQCGEHFGRVSERGLFHTEIQTEDRRLTTLPNLFMVTHPVTTIRASGTMISAEVSLGYDVARLRVKELLLEAAGRAELQDAFVRVMALGDFSVTYRITGMLGDVKQLITARSRLRGRVMDTLHEAGVEIVSPTFMNQRVLDRAARFVPHRGMSDADEDQGDLPEDLIFDKAEQAASLEVLKQQHAELRKSIGEIEVSLKKAAEETAKERLTGELKRMRIRSERLTRVIEHRSSRVDEE